MCDAEFCTDPTCATTLFHVIYGRAETWRLFFEKSCSMQAHYTQKGTVYLTS